MSWVTKTYTNMSRLVANTSHPLNNHNNFNPDTFWTNLVCTSMYVHVHCARARVCVCMYVHIRVCILYKSLIYSFLRFVSRLLILPIRYSRSLFQHCLLASRLTFFRPVLPCFWFCNHWIVACFLWSKNCEHSSWNHGLCTFHSYRPRCSLAEISISSLTFFRA